MKHIIFILPMLSFTITGCVTTSPQPLNPTTLPAESKSSTTNVWLTAHNAVRKKHHAKNLIWSNTIAKSAKKFVKNCPNTHSNTSYGENLSFATNTQTAENVVKQWYSEEKNYNYSKPVFSANTGHFTQIVWQATTHVGCALAKNCSGRFKDVVVCQYYPAGNVVGKFSQNVLPK